MTTDPEHYFEWAAYCASNGDHGRAANLIRIANALKARDRAEEPS